jgi:hypothetical protein
MRGGYRFAPGKRVKAKNESLGSDSIRTDRALVPGSARMAARPARTMVGFISWRTCQRDRGKRRAVDFSRMSPQIHLMVANRFGFRGNQ